MKKLSLIAVFLLSTSAFSKEIPSPFWYNLSEKIITGAHQLIGTDEAAKPVVKAKVSKTVKPVRLPLKCQPKERVIAPLPYLSPACNGIWTEQE